MDKVFTKPIKKQFEFDENVASVFDDMLSRSIPFYNEVIELVCQVVRLNTKESSRVLDLGCSTANTLLHLYHKTSGLNLVGVDNSAAMLERAKKKVAAHGANIELILADITHVDLKKNQIILAHYILQFIRPLTRNEFVAKIADALDKDGLFIFSEKVLFEDKTLNKQMIDIYYEFKKSHGYSEFEIAQKREALENVLVPYTVSENLKMIREAGFSSVETLFQYGNFVTFIAKK